MPAEMVLNHLISKRAKLSMFNINQEEELKTKIKGEDLLFMTWEDQINLVLLKLQHD